MLVGFQPLLLPATLLLLTQLSPKIKWESVTQNEGFKPKLPRFRRRVKETFNLAELVNKISCWVNLKPIYQKIVIYREGDLT